MLQLSLLFCENKYKNTASKFLPQDILFCMSHFYDTISLQRITQILTHPVSIVAIHNKIKNNMIRIPDFTYRFVSSTQKSLSLSAQNIKLPMSEEHSPICSKIQPIVPSPPHTMTCMLGTSLNS